MSDSGIEETSGLSTIDLPETFESALEAGIGTVEDIDDPAVEVLGKDTVFELLKNRRRRDVLRFLRENDGQATLSDVAEFVAARENDIPEGQLSSKQRKRVYVALYQCHLPMMDRAGVIDYNRARGTLVQKPEADQLAEYLTDRVQGSERWSHYLTVTGLGGLLYLFGTLLVGPGSIFATGTVVGLVAAILALSVLDGREALGGRFGGRHKVTEMTSWVGHILQSVGARMSDSETVDR